MHRAVPSRRPGPFVGLATVAALVAGCAAHGVQVRAPRRPAVKILVLAPGGVDPARDTAGYNDFVGKVMQGWSEAFRVELGALGKEISVVFQDPQSTMGDQLVKSVTWGETDAVVVLGLQSEPLAGGEFEISVNARFMPLDHESSGRRRAVVPREGTRLKQPLTKPGGKGWRDTPLAALVHEFVEALQARGEI